MICNACESVKAFCKSFLLIVWLFDLQLFDVQQHVIHSTVSLNNSSLTVE